MKPRLSRSLRRILAGVVVCCLLAQTDRVTAATVDEIEMAPSVVTMGIAWRAALERQMEAVCDRTVVMNGGVPCTVIMDPKAAPVPKPRCDMWLNADIDYQKQSGFGGLPGYKLHGVGGTFGAAGRIGERWMLGGAVTGMHNRISSKEYANDASGDMDAVMGNIFTRFDHGCWSHTLIASGGWTDVDFHRRGNLFDRYFNTTGSPDAWGTGVMYEVARSFRIESGYLASAWWQPFFNVSYFHSHMDAYAENDAISSVTVDSQKHDNVNFGLGARMQTVFGSGWLNRNALFNMQVSGKAVTGKRHGSAAVTFTDGDTVTLRSSRRGQFGLQVGAGFSIPLGSPHNSIFAECTADFMDRYRAVSGVVGYRLTF